MNNISNQIKMNIVNSIMNNKQRVDVKKLGHIILPKLFRLNFKYIILILRSYYIDDQLYFCFIYFIFNNFVFFSNILVFNFVQKSALHHLWYFGKYKYLFFFCFYFLFPLILFYFVCCMLIPYFQLFNYCFSPSFIHTRRPLTKRSNP